MASYFDEHDCEPGPPGPALLQLARSARGPVRRGSLDAADWDQRLPPPAARRVVRDLPAVRGLKCPVCLLEFEEDECARKMPCEHLFHSACLLPWLGKTNSCPLCRHELPTDNPEYEEYKKDKVRQQQREHRLEYLHGAMYT
uniref:E3 ubiquitin-protein ligase RNF181 n=1 Tax=Crocodylus porosus TaxID=8502 RepID=A0A7M4DV09_CROPO